MAEQHPTKLCECGCGQPTQPARYTSVERGWIKGRPKRFIHGHNRPRLKHGHAMAKSSTWHIWANIIQRCTNPNNSSWNQYGGRGVEVCDRWRSFENFLADMGERPDGMSIDRINNDGHYDPSNCRWATPKEQANNRRRARSARLVTAFGETKTMSEWSRDSRCAVGLTTLDFRVRRYMWTPEKAITTPPLPSNFKRPRSRE